MGFLAPLLGPAIGAIAGAFSKSGKQGGQQAQGQQNTNQQTNQLSDIQTLMNQMFGQQSQTSNKGTTTSIEDPLFQLARYGLLDTLGGEINRARTTPIFGPAQKAQFLDTTNEASANAMNRLRSSSAATGALDSGRFGQAATDIELGRAGEISRFNRDLPFAEEQARQARLSPLFNIAAGFFGRPTPGQTTTGETSGTVTGQSTSTGTQHGQTQGQTTGQTTSNLQQNQIGAPWWKNLLGNLGAGFGATDSPFNTGLMKLFAKLKPGVNTSYSNE